MSKALSWALLSALKTSLLAGQCENNQRIIQTKLITWLSWNKRPCCMSMHSGVFLLSEESLVL